MENCEFNQAVSDRLTAAREKIARAAERSGRTADAADLVAVTKYVAPDHPIHDALLAAGCCDFGENRPQKLSEKAAFFAEKSLQAEPAPKKIRWHFIGSLQKNKVRRVLPLTCLIHSVDSPSLVAAIDRILTEEAETAEEVAEKSISSLPSSFSSPFPKKMEILLEVNISGDGNKQGFEPESFLDEIGPLFEFHHVVVRGLMGMGGLESSPAEVRGQFAGLRRLLERTRAAFPYIGGLTELSMGMSHDFEIAVEEGATLVRLGSILYP